MDPNTLVELLKHYQYNFITGVPDSIFKHFLLSLHAGKSLQHVITNNEGEACALAAGYHLATGKVPVVYMQNSGLGNSINPITSLLDENIYSIPTLMLIAWRGLPGEKDEPQHVCMGNVLPGMLSLLNIGYAIADTSSEKMQFILQQAQNYFERYQKPFAILFPKSVFSSVKIPYTPVLNEGTIIREKLLEAIALKAQPNDIIITTTGKTSRELYEIRERLNQDHSQDFLTVGSMGCASSVALGIAMQRPDRRVILIDGDGACLMRLEALATIGHVHPNNLLHIVVDNNAYESTGSQQTLSNNVDFVAIAKACCYKDSSSYEDLTSFMQAFDSFDQGPVMLVVKTAAKSRADLGRPKSTPQENKIALMQRLGVCA